MNNKPGIMDTDEMINSVIIDCNNAVKYIVNGDYIAWCNINTQIVRKLSLIKEGIKKDINAKNEKIEILKQHIKELGGDVVDNVPVSVFDNNKKDGAE